MDKPLVNRVANSGLITVNLSDYFPKEDFAIIDIKDYLFKELILKEKDFRMALKEINWEEYQDKILLLDCSTDAIIPLWAFMLISAYAAPYAKEMYQGSYEEYLKYYYKNMIESIDSDQYLHQRVVIKGCSDKPVPTIAYTEIVKRLQPVVQSLAFGEPCSTVPVFKRPRKVNNT